MRIVGGRDYYDSALAYGHDEHTTYVRGRDELPVPEAEEMGIETAGVVIALHPAGGAPTRHVYYPEYGTFVSATVRGVHHELNFTTVLACGKRYRGIRIDRWSADPAQGETVHFWSRPRLEAWLAEHGLWYETIRGGDDLDAWFQPEELPARVQAAIIARGWTILVHDPGGSWYGRGTGLWRVDQPVLKQVEFYRVVPPNVMFQEIDMWVGGRLASAGAEMIPISDEIRLAKHGMDKTSFRKPKQR
jgi:hypothetical protein